MKHPYLDYPPQSFWSRCVSRNWSPKEVWKPKNLPVLAHSDRIVSAGSCFAANLVPFLEKAGFHYVRTQRPHPSFSNLGPDALSYDKFSAAYGNIYTARQLRQLLDRARGLFQPIEDHWIINDTFVDPYRPGLRFPASSKMELEAIRSQHLSATLKAFSSATVIIYTLGMTEAWVSMFDGAVFPSCPGTVAGSFDPLKHRFHNFSLKETLEDLTSFVSGVREINPHVRFILSVSPVPLVATATANHVLASSMLSKSLLRLAAQELTDRFSFVDYFPSYEIVAGPQAPRNFYQENRRSVSEEGIQEVMAAFFSHCDRAISSECAATQNEINTQQLSQRILEFECEEAFVERR